MADAHSAVDMLLSTPGILPVADEEITITAIEDGSDHQGEIDALEDELADLAYHRRDPNYAARRNVIEAELKRLDSLDREPPRTVKKHTGIKVCDLWPTLTPQQKRAWLLACDARVVLCKSGIQLSPELLRDLPDIPLKTDLAITGNLAEIPPSLTSILPDLAAFKASAA